MWNKVTIKMTPKDTQDEATFVTLMATARIPTDRTKLQNPGAVLNIYKIGQIWIKLDFNENLEN